MTNRTLRVRGGLRFHHTLGLCGDSNHSAQRLAEPRRSAPPFCPFSILIFFAGGDLNWNGVAKRRGGLPVKKQEAVGMKRKCQWCLVHSVIFECPWLKSPSSASASATFTHASCASFSW